MWGRRMSQEANWKEIAITIQSTLRDGHPEDYQLYHERRGFVRTNLIRRIRELNIQEYHILNYIEVDPNTGVKKGFMRFRLLADENTTGQVNDSLGNLQDQNRLDEFSEPTSYDPHHDAQARFGLESAQRKMGVLFENPDINITRFELMLKRTVKNCMEKFLEDFQEPPRDIWLMSVFLHLLLNSLGYDEFRERAIRGFPYM